MTVSPRCHVGEQPVQLRPVPLGAGHFLLEDDLGPLLAEHIQLPLQVLVCGGHPGIADLLLVHSFSPPRRSSKMMRAAR